MARSDIEGFAGTEKVIDVERIVLITDCCVVGVDDE